MRSEIEALLDMLASCLLCIPHKEAGPCRAILCRTMSSAQVGLLCCAVRCLCKQSALAAWSDTALATKRSVRLSSARCVLSGVATGALESVSAV